LNINHLRYIYESRRTLVRIGLPALVSRGTMMLWGILTIFIIRILPSEAYAIYSVAKSLEMFGVLLGGGFIQDAILKLASEGDGHRERQLANSGILMAICFALLSAVLLIAGGGLIGSFYQPLDLTGIPILLAGVVITGTFSGLPRLLLLTVHRTRDVMFVDLIQFAVKSGIIFVLILTHTLQTAHQIFTAMIMANLVSFVTAGLFARNLFFPRAGVSLRRIWDVMSFAMIFMGASLANFVYTRTDTLMLGKIAPGDVAAYGASRSLAGLIMMVIRAANMVLLPHVSRLWSQGRRSEVRPRVWSTLLLSEIIIMPAVVLYVFFPRQLLDVVYGGKYSENWDILLILGALSLVRPFGSFFAAASSAMGKPQYSFYSVIVSAVVNVGLNIYLIPRYGGLGAAIATAAAVILGSTWMVFNTNRFINANT
jgi:O-antigen/teichoic acid export membrane protein